MSESPYSDCSSGAPGPLWRRVIWPTSYWPTRYTRRTWFWNPWHVGAAFARARMRYLVWRGY